MLDVAYVADLIALVLRDSPFPDLPRAVPLLLGTAAQESGFVHTRQLGGGPALGYWQMEPATAREHHAWLCAHGPFREDLFRHTGVQSFSPQALECNLLYGIVLARTHYYRRSAMRLPSPTDLLGQSVLWKRTYNTPGGHGTPTQYQASYRRIVAPRWTSRGNVGDWSAE